MERAAEEQRRIEEQKSAKPAQVANLADALKGFLKLSSGEQGEGVTDVNGRPLDGDSALAKGAHALLSLFEGEASEAKPDSEDVLAAGSFLSWAAQGEAKVLKGGSPITVCGEETGCSLSDAARAFAEWAADKSSSKPAFAEALALAVEAAPAVQTLQQSALGNPTVMTTAPSAALVQEQPPPETADQVANLRDALKGLLELSSREEDEEVTDVDGNPIDANCALAKGAHALLSLCDFQTPEESPDPEKVLAGGSFLSWATRGEAKILQDGSPITVCGVETGISLTDAARAFTEWAADKSSEKPLFAEALALAVNMPRPIIGTKHGPRKARKLAAVGHAAMALGELRARATTPIASVTSISPLEALLGAVRAFLRPPGGDEAGRAGQDLSAGAEALVALASEAHVLGMQDGYIVMASDASPDHVGAALDFLEWALGRGAPRVSAGPTSSSAAEASADLAGATEAFLAWASVEEDALADGGKSRPPLARVLAEKMRRRKDARMRGRAPPPEAIVKLDDIQPQEVQENDAGAFSDQPEAEPIPGVLQMNSKRSKSVLYSGEQAVSMASLMDLRSPHGPSPQVQHLVPLTDFASVVLAAMGRTSAGLSAVTQAWRRASLSSAQAVAQAVQQLRAAKDSGPELAAAVEQCMVQRSAGGGSTQQLRVAVQVEELLQKEAPAHEATAREAPAREAPAREAPAGGSGSEDMLAKVWKRIDTDGSGWISKLEFMAFVAAINQDPEVTALVLPDVDASSLPRCRLDVVAVDAAFGAISGGKPRVRHTEFVDHFREVCILKDLWGRIDADGGGLISKLEFINAVNKDPEIAELVLPGVDTRISLLDSEESFDAANE
ncbi:unnamed protein product, partial [Prorocentrum cordatum]